MYSASIFSYSGYGTFLSTSVFSSVSHKVKSPRKSAEVVKSDTLIVNIGVEDEFGGLIDKKRILNNNQPINFILDEPTHLKFIDPTMALHNAGIKVLYESQSEEKFIIPSDFLNDFYLNIVRRDGIINKELNMLEKYTPQD